MRKLYSKLLIVALTLCTTVAFSQSDLVFTGLISGALPGGVPKALEIYVVNDVADLSAYGIANANNGNPSGGVVKFALPAITATAGDYIYIASETDGFTTYFGFAPDYTHNSLNVNGDDVLELYHNGVVVDYMGEIGVDGTGEPWEYLKGWMYRNNGTGPNTTFTLSEWTFSGVEAIVGAPTNADADSFMPIGTYTTGGGEPSVPVTIAEIQETTDPSGDSPYVGQAVLTSGVVTAISNNGFWIQDGEGSWTGIFVRTAEAPTVLVGDLVNIDATVQENYGLTRLNNVTDLEVVSSGNTLPEPMVLTTGTAGVEEYESVLISLTGATCVNNDLGFGEWAIDDGSGQYRVGVESGMYSTDPVNFTTYDITGIAHYSHNNFKIVPRVVDDVVVTGDVTGLSFEVSELIVNETDGTVTVNVEITNPAATPTTVEVAVIGGTAGLGTHFDFTDPTTLTFAAESTESQSFTFDLIDDDEANENRTITFELQNADDGVMFGHGVLEVTIADDDTVIEITPIGVVAEVDDQGVAINLGEEFTVTGIVHGVNMNGNGLSITLIDGTGGIGLYSPSPVAYQVTEGDSIVVSGTVDQFNGLTQLSFLSPIQLISQGHELMEPIVVTELIESLESHLVTIECVFVVDASQWTGSGSGFTVTVENVDGDQFAMRIDNDTELYSAAAPTGTFNLTGLVGQFVFDPPYLTGYQVLPRYMADIEASPECGVPDGVKDINNFSFDVYPNPASDRFFVETPIAIHVATLINVVGQEVKASNFNASQHVEINVNGLDAGIYILKLRSVDNQISTTKVVVK